MSDRALTSPEGLSLLSSRLRVLMMTLSLLICVVIAWLVPALYEKASLLERQAEAELAARTLSSSLRRLSLSYPHSWPYRYRDLQREAELIIKMGSYVQLSTERLGGSEAHYFLIDRLGVRRLSKRALSSYTQGQPSGLLVGQAKISAEAGGLGAAIRVYIHHQEGRTIEHLWLIAAALGLLISVLISVVPLRLSRHGDQQNRRLWTALQELNRTLEDQIEVRTAELDLINARLMSVQEEERARISRDLHDELGQTLTAARLQLTTSSLLDPQSEAARVSLSEGIKELDKGVEQVRSIAYALRPPELDKLGLLSALERHIEERAHSAGLRSKLQAELPELSAALNTTVFRVVQEGITNVIRHAQATELMVRVSCTEDEVLIEVSDNGRGLPSPPLEGVGLIGLRSRVREHQGGVRLLSSASGGARLLVSLKRALS